MKSGIYQIVNVTNGKTYIGSSKSLSTRRYTHFRDLRKGSHVNPHLLHAWRECGEAAFHFSVLEYCPRADLLERESWWMDLLGTRSREKGYNLWDAERHDCAAETRAKLSKAHSGEKNGFFGKKHSPESLAKMAESSKGQIVSAETRAKQSKVRKGRKYWWGEKISQAKMGHEVTEETRARIAASRSGLRWSEAQRADYEQRKADGRLDATGAKIAERKAKTYLLTAPSGETITVHNLTQYCKANGLNAARLVQVAKGKEPHHKGWKAMPMINTDTVPS